MRMRRRMLAPHGSSVVRAGWRLESGGCVGSLARSLPVSWLPPLLPVASRPSLSLSLSLSLSDTPFGGREVRDAKDGGVQGKGVPSPSAPPTLSATTVCVFARARRGVA
jgi:hypothetical protein